MGRKKEIPRTVDIDAAIRKKARKKWVPRFATRILEKIIRQDFINAIIYRNRDAYGLEFVDAIIKDFELHIHTQNESRIPDSGRFIFAANHPLGGIESMAFMRVVGNHFENIIFPVNDFLMNLPNLNPLFVPINKFGGQNRDSVTKLGKAYSSDAQILYYPAGLVSRKTKGKISDPEWKTTIITKAKQHQRDIIPVFIDGRNSNFFYWLASMRKRLNIKFNIEMMFLPNETYKQKQKDICLSFGSPLPYTMFDNSKTPQEWTEFVRNKVYAMDGK